MVVLPGGLLSQEPKEKSIDSQIDFKRSDVDIHGDNAPLENDRRQRKVFGNFAPIQLSSP